MFKTISISLNIFVVTFFTIINNIVDIHSHTYYFWIIYLGEILSLDLVDENSVGT